MVRAVRREVDPKTQTRRVAKFVALEQGLNFGFTGLRAAQDRPGGWTLQSRDGATNLNDRTEVLRCPYGQPGDRLWGRETFYAFGRWVTQFNAKKGRDEWHFIDMTLETGHAYCYAADGGQPAMLAGKRDVGITPKWWKRPAIFMPRAASRILQEVTEVRVERLQSISEEDAIAEGIPEDGTPCPRCHFSGWVMQGGDPVECDAAGCGDGAVDEYRTLWESINGAGSWNANPWVWAVSLKDVSALAAIPPSVVRDKD